jgi:hypothetical protein
MLCGGYGEIVGFEDDKEVQVAGVQIPGLF